MIMASPGLISMPGQVLTQQRAPHGCQAQQNHNMQNKLRPTTPSNNNCMYCRFRASLLFLRFNQFMHI